MASMYYREAAGAIVTFDLTSMESYEGAESWLREVSVAAPEDVAIALVGQLIRHAPANLIDLRIGTKADLKDRAINSSTVKRFARNKNILYMEISAKTGENVNKLFEELGIRCW